MNEVVNNNKYNLKYWFAMFYVNGRKFIIGSMVTLERLSIDFIYCYLIKIWAPIFVHPKAVTDLKNALHYPPAYSSVRITFYIDSIIEK